jgi:outer membrane protein assembly factor BamE (lipoprotein component of BamABCDE complex)
MNARMKAILLFVTLALLNSCAHSPAKHTQKITRLETKPIEGGFFTLGSTKNQVIALHGSPDKIDTFKDGAEWWRYRVGSYVYFKHGAVVGWEFTDLSQPPPKAYLGTGSNAETIAQGSTLDDVVAAMGTPTAFQVMGSGVTWVNYGDSRIHMREGRVISWDDRDQVLTLGPPPEANLSSEGRSATMKRLEELRKLRIEYMQKGER